MDPLLAYVQIDSAELECLHIEGIVILVAGTGDIQLVFLQPGEIWGYARTS